jgi:hypothetical protein
VRRAASLALFHEDEFGDRGRGFDKTWWALIGGELEKTMCLLLVLLQQRQLAAIEIGLAGLCLFRFRVGIRGRFNCLFKSELV